MVYSEKMKKWIHDIRVIQFSSKQVWLNYKERIMNVNHTRLIPQPEANDNNGVSSLLKRHFPLNSKQQPNILITQIVQPNDKRCESATFNLGKAK